MKKYYSKKIAYNFHKVGMPVLCTVVLVLLASCVSRNEKMGAIDDHVSTGNFGVAYEELNTQKDNIYSSKKDSVLFLLDSGMLALHALNTKTSIEELSNADGQMDELRKKNIGEQIAASAINDSFITYNGASYEYVFTSIMLSLGYLSQNKFDSGFVEMRRSQDKLTKIQVDNDLLLSQYNKDNKDAYVEVDEIKVPFVDSALARMLSFWLYRADADFSNMEVAERKYRDAIETQPIIYNSQTPQISDEQFSMKGTRIQVVSMTDRAPILFENKFSLNAVEGGVVVATYSEGANLPSNVKPVSNSFFTDLGVIPIPGMDSSGFSVVFAVPALATYEPKIDAIEIWANKQKLGNLSITENLEEIALQNFKQESKLMYARQFSRVVIKTLAGLTANQVDPWLGFAAQIVNNASERADTRISRYFPAKIWTGDFAVPGVGEYNISIKYYKGATLIRENSYTQKITTENDTFNLIIDSIL